MGLRIKTLEVRIFRGELGASVNFENQENIVLEYDDRYVRTLDLAELRAILTHEACHVATLPSSKTFDFPNAPREVRKLPGMLIDIFGEFLAHKEFVKRFGQEEIFRIYHTIKMRDFPNYDAVMFAPQLNVMNHAEAIFTILNDAVYFPLVGDDSFEWWCKSKGLERLPDFLSWLIQDFEYIKSLSLPELEELDRLVLECKLCLTVDLDQLFMRGVILFDSHKEQADALVQPLDAHLSEAWRSRGVQDVGPGDTGQRQSA